MRKIGKLNQFFSIVIVSLFSFALAHAQEVKVSAALSETNIFSGEQSLLEITVSGTSLNSLNQPQLPELEGVRWLQGRTQRGTNYTISNGKPSVTYTFGYVLIAQEPGTYRIPAIEISANNKNFKTKPISFKVLDPNTIDSGEAERAPDIYVRMEPSNGTPVVGEQVLVEVVLYFKNTVDVASYQATPGWKAEGFWKEELQYPQRAKPTSSIINGVRYQRARLLQYAIFPTKSGELTLSPFEISVSIRQQRSSNSIFNLGFNQERKNLETLPVTLNVRSMPELDNAQFIGAVGSFKISRSLEPASALVGESIEITTRIEGTGNVPLVNKPDYDYPDGLELYNPQQNSSISRDNRQISGYKTYTDVVIARNEGTFTVPELNVAYYDPRKKDYEINVLPALTFTVERDPNAVVSNTSQLRLDIQPITGLAQWTSTQHTSLHEKTWVWLLLALPLLITGGVFAYKSYQERLNTDTAFARSQKANAKAQDILKQAEQTTDIKKGYYLIERALTQFITDKLNLPPAGLSSEKIISEVQNIAGDDTATELKRLFNKCETIAYAPNATQAGLDSDIQKTRKLLKTIGKFT